MEKQGAALIVVDVQNDFMSDTSVSTLPVAWASKVIKPINAAMKDFAVVVATQDWHPAGHKSFASSRGVPSFTQIPLHTHWATHPMTLWPDHCIQGSWGAMFEPTLDLKEVDLILRKGTNPEIDSYSAFKENFSANGTRATTGLEAWLRAKGVYKVFVCGIAKDVCVRYTAEDAIEAGFQTYVFDSLCRSVDPKKDDELTAEFKRRGIGVIW